MMTP
jgi:hypothetical protein